MPADEKSLEPLSHIYAPPRATAPLPARAKIKSGRAQSRLVLSMVTFGATLALIAVFHLDVAAARWMGIVGFGASAVAALLGAGSAAAQVLSRATWTRGPLAGVAGVFFLLANLAMMTVGAFTTLWATVGFARGRQLRHFGRIRLPPVVVGHSWAHTKVTVADRESIPTEVATQWRENGRTEHASVAAFARLTLDLMALGAPPHLVSASHADAMDEVRHTELCFSLARSIDGDMQDPGPFPAARSARARAGNRRMGLALLAVDSLVDGALHEGVSARVVAKLAKRSDVAAIRGVLKEIAADEGRHSAHGWDVVEWCLAEGGRPVASALRGALRVLPTEMQSSLPGAAVDGSWERWGIQGAELEQEEYSTARAMLIARVEQLTAARAA